MKLVTKLRGQAARSEKLGLKALTKPKVGYLLGAINMEDVSAWGRYDGGVHFRGHWDNFVMDIKEKKITSFRSWESESVCKEKRVVAVVGLVRQLVSYGLLHKRELSKAKKLLRV